MCAAVAVSVPDRYARTILTRFWKTSTAIGGGDEWIWTGHPLGDNESHGEWLVACRVEPQDDRLVIAEIRLLPWPTSEQEERWVAASLEPPPPGALLDDNGEPIGPSRVAPATPAGGLTSRAVRTLRTEPALEKARRTLGYIKSDLLPPRFAGETIRAARRPGRRGRPDRFYAEIAAAYIHACNSGSRTPIPDVTHQLAEKGLHYSKDAVRDLVHDARRRGMLTKPPRGRAGGRLTDKAAALLAESSR